jgi:AcrR family transcriptional regulator
MDNYLEKLDHLTELEVNILNAAKDEFEKKGYHKANVDSIAAELNIGKATVYRHFGNKMMLFIMVILFIFNLSKGNLEKAGLMDDFEEALEFFMENLIERNRKTGRLISVIMNMEENSFAIKEELGKSFHVKAAYKYFIQIRQAAILNLGKIIEKGKAESKVADDINSTITAEIVFVSINNYLKVHHSFGEVEEELGIKKSCTIDDCIIELKKFIYRGIGISGRNHE